MPSFWRRIAGWFTRRALHPTRSASKRSEPAVTSPRPDVDWGDSKASSYPKSYAAGVRAGLATQQVFDPALRQYPRAFRLGDPEFADPELAWKWRAYRDDVMHRILRIAMEPPWEPHLVLRGSLLLTAWLGVEARQPGDLDFVFRPQAAGMRAHSSKKLVKRLIAAVSERCRNGARPICIHKVSIDDIWTYDRAPGRRIVFPWTAEDTLSGVVRVDIVFGERLWEPPIRVVIPSRSVGDTQAWAASQALSLAWKLLWLETDAYPQGKDLYDATLLAERTSLSLNLLRKVLRAHPLQHIELKPDFPMRWEVDWDNFRLEYPWVKGDATDWQTRLTHALEPMFGAAPPDVSSK